jgi:hypothetical protein
MSKNHQLPKSLEAVLLHPHSAEALANAIRSFKKKYSPTHFTLLVISHRKDKIDYAALQSIVDLEFPKVTNKIVTIPVKGIMQKTWSTLKRNMEFAPTPQPNDANRKTKARSIASHNKHLLDYLAHRQERLLLEMYCLHAGAVGFALKRLQSATEKSQVEIIEL